MTKPNARDDADYAADEEEAHRQEALWRARKPTRLQLRRSCYNCGDAVPADKHFCDADCRRDYERRERRDSQGDRT